MRAHVDLLVGLTKLFFDLLLLQLRAQARAPSRHAPRARQTVRPARQPRGRRRQGGRQRRGAAGSGFRFSSFSRVRRYRHERRAENRVPSGRVRLRSPAPALSRRRRAGTGGAAGAVHAGLMRASFAAICAHMSSSPSICRTPRRRVSSRGARRPAGARPLRGQAGRQGAPRRSAAHPEDVQLALRLGGGGADAGRALLALLVREEHHVLPARVFVLRRAWSPHSVSVL